MELTEKMQAFVMHCGEMGSRWGFNRTIGQMYALLLLSEQPLSANELSQTLHISRGNVSMGIKELNSWQLIATKHKPGDRKEYYQPAGTIWQMANRVFEQRQKREIDPTLSLLRDNLLDEPNNQAEQYAQQRMLEIHDLLEMITQWAGELQRLSPEKLSTLMKLGAGVTKMLDMRDKFTGKSTPES